jgi:hypothetical protein
MEKLLRQASPAQFGIVTVDVVDDYPSGGKGDTCRGFQQPQKLMGLIFDPGSIALAKEQFFQVGL